MTVAVLVIGAAPAAKANGCAKVHVTFHNKIWGHCSSPRDCTGSLYSTTHYDTQFHLRNVKVTLVSNTGVVLASTNTDNNGVATFSWVSAGTPYARAITEFEHFENRWQVFDGSGNVVTRYDNYQFLTSGTGCGAPQDLGEFDMGSSAYPDEEANVYASAMFAYANAFDASNRLISYFDNIEIRNGSASCPTSCAVRSHGTNGRVYLDTGSNTPFNIMNRTAHELGHLASMYSSPGTSFLFAGDYTYDNPNITEQSGWIMTDPEYGNVQFEEGLATFWGVRTFWNSTATTPGVCGSSSPCDGSLWSAVDVELSRDLGGDCVTSTEEDRWPVSALRYLWDVYDAPNDSESNNQPTYTFVDTLTAYATGYGNNQEDEPWSYAFGNWWVDDLDGRSCVDYAYNHNAEYSVSTTTALTNNCSPVGD